MVFQHFNIFRYANYLLHTARNDIEVIRLTYSVSNTIKTDYFINFITLINLNKFKYRSTNFIMIGLYLFKFKSVKDVYLLNLLNSYENGIKFINKIFK